MNLNNSGGVVFRQLMGGGEAFSLLSDAHSALINLKTMKLLCTTIVATFALAGTSLTTDSTLLSR